jgi:hypothetical protein
MISPSVAVSVRAKQTRISPTLPPGSRHRQPPGNGSALSRKRKDEHSALLEQLPEPKVLNIPETGIASAEAKQLEKALPKKGLVDRFWTRPGVRK